MAKLKKYNLAGEETGEAELNDLVADAEVSGQALKDYVVAMRKNARQWSASTKVRKEVNHSGKKPHRQKGLGRARQGSLAAPQFKGGGVVFGPKPKFDQHVRINQKERRRAVLALIGEKAREGRLVVLESVSLDSPSTKSLATFLKKAGLKERTLVLGEQGSDLEKGCHSHLSKSIRNLPKTHFGLLANTNGYDLLRCGNIVVTEPALAELNQLAESTGRKRS